MAKIAVMILAAVLALLPCLAQASEKLAPGLTHSEYRCKVQGRPLEFEELRLESGKGLEIRALHNATAVQNPRCRAGYGGPDLETLLKTKPPRGIEVLGATNGTLFRVKDRQGSDGSPVHGYISNHLLWSRGTGLIAPLRKQGGSHVLIADADGAHEVTLRFEKCGPSATCIRTQPKLAQQTIRPENIAEALLRAYPSMTLALQSNMPLVGDVKYLACPQGGSDWRCQHLARTAICGRRDGSLSLITTSGAYPQDLSAALGAGGKCRAGCTILLNLDGGGSTQMGYRSKAGEWVQSGSKMETSQPGCSPYRPVDNYLTIGKPR